MSPRRTLAITRRLFSQFRHDRRTLAILFAAPLLILGIFALLLRTDSQLPSIGVVDLDEGPLGPAIVEQLATSDLVAARELDLDEAEAALADDEVDGYVLLPEDLSTAVISGPALRPEIQVTGTEPAAEAAILQALQRSMLAAVAELAADAGNGPGGPGGAGAPATAVMAVPELDPMVSYRYGGGELDPLDLLGGPFIGLVVFTLVYIVTSVAFLRERSQGTLERLMASPLRRTEIVVGYMLGFTVVALVQAGEVLLFGLYVLDLYNAGNVALIFGIEVLLALAAVNLGIFLSTFARSEFQAVQFIPLVIAPQILLSGVIVPVSTEPEWLQVVSNALPLTYAVEAMRLVMIEGADLATAQVARDVAVIAGFCVLVIVAAAATLRRQVA